MELGLRLGEAAASKPFGFKENTDQVSNKLGLSFCTTLSIGLIGTTETEEAEQYNKTLDPDDENGEDRSEIDKHRYRHTISSKSNPPVQLDLLPHSPVVPHNPQSHLSFPWPPSSENGSSADQAGSSKGLDLEVNKLAAAGEEEAEEGAAVSSSPNSAASSFQMDLCIYTRGGNLSRSRKRDSDGEAYDHQKACSRASDEDENGASNRKKLRLSKEQSAFLEESFKEHSTLNPKQKLALAKQLNLRPRQVEVWFQNRRARTKLKQTEVDCEYLKRCCETLTEENRRLQKELQELRALKAPNPFYMQLPATTLTMCPSCERVATNSTCASSTTPSTAAASSSAGPTAIAKTPDPTNKSIGFPFNNKPRFYPFPHPTPKHTQSPTNPPLDNHE